MTSERAWRVMPTAALLLLWSTTVVPAVAQSSGAAANVLENRYPAAETSPPFLDDQVLFPEEPHSWYRIPSIVVAKSGVVLAFAERRIGTSHDYGRDGESVLRRSFDHGKTWGPIQTIISQQAPRSRQRSGGGRLPDRQDLPHLQVGVVERALGRSGTPKHSEEMKALGYASYEIHSDDDGETWSEPRNLNLSSSAGEEPP